MFISNPIKIALALANFHTCIQKSRNEQQQEKREASFVDKKVERADQEYYKNSTEEANFGRVYKHCQRHNRPNNTLCTLIHSIPLVQIHVTTYRNP